MQIILNADDFGKSPERNKAINEAFQQHLVTSAGLIVTGQYLQDAVNKAIDGGYIDKLHVHFNLSANLMHENSEDIPLTEAMQKDSFFCSNRKFKPYKGLPHKILDIRKWKTVYNEIIAQYDKFKEVTKGKADYAHVDFHLWYNLTWPVSVALNKFTRKYKIKSVRYIGMHQMNKKRYRLFLALSRNSHVSYIPATNIDYYLSKNEQLSKYKIVELYCHPNYKDGVFLDDSPSYLKHDREPMPKQIQMLKETGNVEFLSWEDL